MFLPVIALVKNPKDLFDMDTKYHKNGYAIYVSVLRTPENPAVRLPTQILQNAFN